MALQRGPLVYCLESVDNPGIELLDLRAVIDETGQLRNARTRFESRLLKGVVTIEGDGEVEDLSDAPLYQSLSRFSSGEKQEYRFKAIPYYTWCNRGSGQMTVWLQSEKCRR